MPIDMREVIAAAIVTAFERYYPAWQASEGATTSGCPVLKVVIDDVPYNITITKARKT